MEVEMSTESEATMFARKPKRWIRKIRRELVDQAVEEKGIARRDAQAAVDAMTDETIMHATYSCGITAEQVGDGIGSWLDWLRDMFSKVDWLSVVLKLLPLIFLSLGNQTKAVDPVSNGEGEG